MFQYRYTPVLLAFLASAADTSAIELELGKSYELTVTQKVKEVDSPTCPTAADLTITAAKRSKFTVSKLNDTVVANKCYVIRFLDIWDYGTETSVVTKDKFYYLPETTNGIDNSLSTIPYGMASGLLVVPFKVRAEDESITGGATIGGYIGWDLKFVRFILGGGLAQIDVADGAGNTDSKTGLSFATGILLNNWDGIDFGLVVGFDHLGGSTGDAWIYEDDPWISFMIGWSFSQ